MVSINFVCTGNICRSAMAQVVAQSELAEAGLDGQVTVTSSGVSDEEHGNPMDYRAVRALVARGYPTGARHRAHRITQGEIDRSDMLVAMTMGHVNALLRRGAQPDRVWLLRQFEAIDRAGVKPKGYDLDLDDPWYGGKAEFEHALDQIEAGVAGLLAFVERDYIDLPG
ncbi:MAG: low molecular weight phosphotyrosine protein phosphatase [Bifidobacteriaceae bacterium]|jgi:protein-tyrosine phosphatase|nr:low molecular weight phosphotyrosine protein phosphatase [Bifidobacteriaceae bacterium]